VRGDGLAATRPRHIAGVHDTLGVEKLPGIGIKGQMTTRLLTVHHDAEVMGGCKPLLAPSKHHCATVPLCPFPHHTRHLGLRTARITIILTKTRAP
jgi:hypothetical protein